MEDIKEVDIELLTLPLKVLKKYNRNNKIHTEKGISELVENFKKVGIIDPIFVDEKNEILAGHKRLAALLAVGKTETNVIKVVGLEEDSKKIYRISSNKLTKNSDDHIENICSELSFIQIEEKDLLGLTFDLFSDDYNHVDIDQDFINEKIEDYQKIIIHFSSEAQVLDFSKKINYKITNNTKFINYEIK